jgi:hypothetical protein
MNIDIDIGDDIGVDIGVDIDIDIKLKMYNIESLFLLRRRNTKFNDKNHVCIRSFIRYIQSIHSSSNYAVHVMPYICTLVPVYIYTDIAIF